MMVGEQAVASMQERIQYGALIGGRLKGSIDGEWIEVHNPASASEVVARVPAMSAGDVEVVYEAAQGGLGAWRRESPVARGEVLRAAARGLRERGPDLARAITLDMGKTLAEAHAEVLRAAEFFDYYAGFGRLAEGETLPDSRAATTSWTRCEPVGVILAITPWNDPLLTPARKLAPALLAGNAVILKPALLAPTSAMILAEVLNDAGVSAGAINTVTGKIADLGGPLLEHDALDGVSFTGSTATGMELERRLAARNVRVATEMGGKNAAVVLADADREHAARTIAAGAFGQSGQRCTATSRVIAHESLVEPLLSRLGEEAANILVGPGIDPRSTMGPLVCEEQLDAVLAGVEAALDQGARRVAGEGRMGGSEHRAGWFMTPMVLAGVERDMDIWRDELFGPVLALHSVGTLEEAIEAANDGPYGLSTSVFTNDLSRAMRCAGELESGQVAINLPTSGWDVHLPFGGWGQSGSGWKEQGSIGLDFYRRVKTISLNARG